MRETVACSHARRRPIAEMKKPAAVAGAGSSNFLRRCYYQADLPDESNLTKKRHINCSKSKLNLQAGTAATKKARCRLAARAV